MRKFLFVTCLVLILSAIPLGADFVVVGPVEAAQCSNYLLFESCSFVNVDAVRTKDGIHNFATKFEKVDEYIPASGYCVIRENRGLLIKLRSLVFGAERTPLRKKPDGSYAPISATYYRFPCVRR